MFSLRATIGRMSLQVWEKGWSGRKGGKERKPITSSPSPRSLRPSEKKGVLTLFQKQIRETDAAKRQTGEDALDI